MSRYDYIPNRILDANGDATAATIGFYAAGTTTPIAIFGDAALTVPLTNPCSVASGAAVPDIFFAGAPDEVRVRIVAGATTLADDDPFDPMLRGSDLAGAEGTALIGFAFDGSGAVTRVLLDKLRETLSVTPADFGTVDPTGATNCTAAFVAFYEHCIATGARGHVPAGRYRLTPGALFFDNGGVDKAFPDISTAGHGNVTYVFDPASSVDEPMIVVTNGRAGSANPGGNWTGGDGNYWTGGSHGGITIEDTATANSKANRHGLELQGWTYPRFGFILYKGNHNGSAVYLPEALFNDAHEFNGTGAYNPDPCAISLPVFEGIEAQFAKYTIENRNTVGMDGWQVDYVRGIVNSEGGIYGCGQGCRFPSASFGSCAGWAFDDGTQAGGVAAACNRVEIGGWEVDDCQYGLRLSRFANSDISRVRFNHRYNSSFTPFNPGEGFWPRICIDLAGGTGASVVNVRFDQIIHRIQPLEAGVNPAGKGGGPAFGAAALGTLIRTTAPGSVSNVDYDHQYIDNAVLGIDTAKWHSGFNLNARVRLASRGVPFYASLYGHLAHVSYSGSAPSIAASGFGGAGSIVAFNAERLDLASSYDASQYCFVAPWTGHLEVSASLETTLAAGTRVQIAAMKQAAGGGAYSIASSSANQASGTLSQCYQLPANIIAVTQGEKIFIAAVNNGGAAAALTPSIAASASCWAKFKMVGDPS